tara:strand:- start:46 stop:462 length:417 start_codon:yes stop_codon:yes gene_type:complete
MTLFDYFTKALTSKYWQTRVAFYNVFNNNVLDALREQGWQGKYMSAGDMSRCLTAQTKMAYSNIVTRQTEAGEYVTTNWTVTSYADRWLNNVHGVAQFNKALVEAGFDKGSFTVEQDSVLARELGYRANEYLFKLNTQ